MLTYRNNDMHSTEGLPGLPTTAFYTVQNVTRDFHKDSIYWKISASQTLAMEPL